jgi:hypothetical protein
MRVRKVWAGRIIDTEMNKKFDKAENPRNVTVSDKGTHTSRTARK